MSEEHIDTVDYAMNALDDVARRRADRHVEQCAQCRAEVAEWLEATSVLGESVQPVAPPASLRDSVLAAAAQTAQDDKHDAPAPGPEASGFQPPPSRRHPGRWLLAAAAAVVLIGGGVTVAAHPWTQGPAPVSAVARVTNAPDAQSTRKPVDGGTLVMVYSGRQQKAVATLRDVPAAAGGKVYQAWLITPSGMVDAGLLSPGKPTVLKGSIAGATGAAVTVEPAGGSKQPTSKPIVSVSMA